MFDPIIYLAFTRDSQREFTADPRSRQYANIIIRQLSNFGMIRHRPWRRLLNWILVHITKRVSVNAKKKKFLQLGVLCVCSGIVVHENGDTVQIFCMNHPWLSRKGIIDECHGYGSPGSLSCRAISHFFAGWVKYASSIRKAFTYTYNHNINMIEKYENTFELSKISSALQAVI